MQQRPRMQCARSIPPPAPTAGSRTERSDRRPSSLTVTGVRNARHVRGNGGAARSFPSLLLFGLSPLGPHLGESLHVYSGLVAFLLGRQTFQQFYRMHDVVLNRAFGGLEINLPDFRQDSL